MFKGVEYKREEMNKSRGKARLQEGREEREGGEEREEREE